MNEFLIIGGDERFLFAAKYIAAKTPCSVYGFCKKQAVDVKVSFVDDFDKIFYYQNIVLPLPVTRDGVNLHTPLFDGRIAITSLVSFPEGTKIYAGIISPELKKLWDKYVTVDYYNDEFAMLNAIPTAEGVIGTIIKESKTTISDMNILVVGGGRTAKSIVRLLSGFTKNITITARDYEQLEFMKTFNVNTVMLNNVNESLSLFDTAINTVPAKTLDLTKLKSDCLFVDITTCGLGEFVPKNLHYIHALNLPGSYFPKTAGRIIADCIMKRQI